MTTITSLSGKHEFLSNFFPCQLVDVETGLVFPTSEHLFQAKKTKVLKEKVEIQLCSTPGKAKRLGRKITLREDWELVKKDVMLEILREKFSQPELSKMLKDTRDDVIIEGNEWHDVFWGKCFCETHKGIGHNILGLLLMKVRDELK